MSETITFYHNPRCSKSRQALALLEENGITPDIVLYLQNPPTVPELKRLLKILGIRAHELVRSKEKAFKELGLNAPETSEDALLNAMTLEPKLIERPIAVKGNRAIIGRPPENVLTLL